MPPLTERARRLRRDQTEAEAKLWATLRGGHLNGHKFRRQFPIERYIADFACPAARLIIEADGNHHDGNDYDRRRDAWLAAQGWRVLRFTNDDVYRNLDGVLRMIELALAEAPSPTAARRHAAKPSYPLPQGEREDHDHA
ncbi:MAG: endonuclease domain-containing protein [Pacificimonas sp.]|jgi:very-short-patch-repair endonuclease|nr:endonuclease domain-containing protein [Pacificimonas sp.]